MAGTRKINWAVIGLGKQGERIAGAINNSGNGHLKAVYSESPDRAQAFRDKFGGEKVYSDYSLLLSDKDIEAFFISSATFLHAEQCVKALEAGKHVFCEKPMSLTAKEALGIKSAADKSKSKFAVGFHLRTSGALREARTMIASGKIGKPISISMNWSIGTPGQKDLPPLPPHMQWREHPDKSGGGALMARGTHLFDLLRFLTSSEVNIIKAISDNGNSAVDITSSCLVETKNKILAQLLTSRALPFSKNDIIVYGELGRIILSNCLEPGQKAKFELVSEKENCSKEYPAEDLYKKEIEEFGQAIRESNGHFPLADINDGVQNVLLIKSFHMSIKK